MVILLIISRRLSNSILIVYIFILLSITLFSRRSGYYRTNFIPFRTYQKGLTDQIKYNILAFIPIGVLPKRKWKWIGPALSVIIELIQLLFHKGQCDIDDLISNTIGVIIGILISFMVKQIARGSYKDIMP